MKHLFHADLGKVLLDEKDLDVKDKTILSIARRYDYQPAHAHQVAKLAGILFDKLACWHKLSQKDRVLLQYAAILHDIGYHISHTRHHKHAYYLIQNSEAPGFNPGEVAIIANLVRFHRGNKPSKKKHKCYSQLSKIARRKVLKMSALLRLADGLDRTHRSLVEDIQIEYVDNIAQAYIVSKESCELEVWYTKQIASYFEEVFKKKIVVKLFTPTSSSN